MTAKHSKTAATCAIAALFKKFDYANAVAKEDGRDAGVSFLRLSDTAIFCADLLGIIDRSGMDIPERLAKAVPIMAMAGWSIPSRIKCASRL